MDTTAERERLQQTSRIEELTQPLQPLEMVTVYLSDNRESEHDHGIYCALIPSANAEDSLDDYSWDLMIGGGQPGTVQSFNNGEQETRYYRFGDDSGIEPLIICRDFYRIRPDYCELSEEFRLFHNLYYDKVRNLYVKIDESGGEIIVAIMESHKIQVRLKEIRQFIAIKEMHLAIFFDFKEFSQSDLSELSLSECDKSHRDELTHWIFGSRDGKSDVLSLTFSRLLGKRLITPLLKEESGFFGFSKKISKQYIDFIIGIDDQGNDKTYTCNPNLLANYFGANPTAPNFLTPVSFQKNVLDKYYRSSKYSVSDNVLRCGDLWSVYIDNHHDHKVSVWLGDLGKQLPYNEQLHWRSHNIASLEGVSKTFYQRQILSMATNSERLEHKFQTKYQKLASICDQHLGWNILLPLSPDDQHLIKSIRIPTADEPADFDELVLALAKILIDSLNEKALMTLISDTESLPSGSIARLKHVLCEHHVREITPHIDFLRELQSLRSTGSAHRKGDNYEKALAKFGIDRRNRRDILNVILTRVIDLLDFLCAIVPEIAREDRLRSLPVD